MRGTYRVVDGDDDSITLQDSADPRWRVDVALEGTAYRVTVSTATSSAMFEMFDADFPAIEAPADSGVVGILEVIS